MKIAIHQPHYFPWLGYMDKMAKVDRFVIMDQVQLENKSYMCRNRILDREGNILLLTIPCKKKGYRDKEYREIELDNTVKWQKQHRHEIMSIYKYSPYVNEIMNEIGGLFENHYEYLSEVTLDSILILKKIFNIQTEVCLQSELDLKRRDGSEVDKKERQSKDVLDICKAAGGTEYLTGKGASIDFLNSAEFEENGVNVSVQEYQCPIYYQRFTNEFIPNISSVDLLLNNGIEKSNEIFWENVKKGREFERKGTK